MKATKASLMRNVDLHGAGIVLPELHSGHLQIKREMKALNILCAGRGWRKTTFLMDWAIEGAMLGETVGWYAHVWDPIKDVLENHFKKALGEELYEACYHVGNKILHLPDCAPIYFHSLKDHGTKVGPSYKRIIGDEAGKWPRGTYHDVLSPIRFKSQGQTLLAGTPNPADPFNDFYDMLMIALKGAPSMAGWHVPTLGAKVEGERLIRKAHPYENPAYTFDMLLTEWMLTPINQRNMFRINMLCEFISGGGKQFDKVIECCILPFEGDALTGYWLKGYRPSPDRSYRLGGDVGLSDNETALSVVDEESQMQVFLQHFVPDAASDTGRWEQIYQAYTRVSELFSGIFNVDITGLGQHLEETLGNRGVTIQPVNYSGNSNKKVSLMDGLAQFFSEQKWQFLNIEEQKRQFDSIQRIELEKSTSIAAPKARGAKGRDDIPNAVALSLMGLKADDFERTEASNLLLPSTAFGGYIREAEDLSDLYGVVGSIAQDSGNGGNWLSPIW